jgi:hypothetical protein
MNQQPLLVLHLSQAGANHPWGSSVMNCSWWSHIPDCCDKSESESESYITTDNQSASLYWNKAPIWGLRPDIYLSLTITALFLWASSLTRGRDWLLYMLLALASVVFLGSEKNQFHRWLTLTTQKTSHVILTKWVHWRVDRRLATSYKHS